MNPQFRKVALIAAALGLLLSLFLALRPSDEENAPTSATPTRTATGSNGPGTVHIEYTVTGGKPAGGIGRDSVSRGRLIVLRVTSDASDEVHLHGYDLMRDVAPGAPATIRFTADVPGRFEIELERSGVQVGELEVRP